MYCFYTATAVLLPFNLVTITFGRTTVLTLQRFTPSGQLLQSFFFTTTLMYLYLLSVKILLLNPVSLWIAFIIHPIIPSSLLLKQEHFNSIGFFLVPKTGLDINSPFLQNLHLVKPLSRFTPSKNN